MIRQRVISDLLRWLAGWLNTLHPPLSGWGKFAEDEWELYDLSNDRAQARNIADQETDRLADRPHGTPVRDRYVYYPDCASVPEMSGVLISGRSYTSAAGVDVSSPDAEGVLYAHGGVAGGHSLYVKDRHLHYVFNWVGSQLQVVDSDREVTPGAHVFTAEFTAKGRSADPAMPGATGTLTLYIDDHAVGSSDIVTQPGYFNAVGDGICVGRDDASPVTPDFPRLVPARLTTSSARSSASGDCRRAAAVQSGPMSQPAHESASRGRRSASASNVPKRNATASRAPNERTTAADGSGAAAAAKDVTDRHSVTFTLPVVGQVWLGEPKHLPFYFGVAAVAWLEIIEWPVAAVVVVGKLLADNAHRETLRDFGRALEAEA